MIERRAIDVETLVQRALSMGSTSRAHLGERMPAMVAELRAALADVREEVVEASALVAWRAALAAGGMRRLNRPASAGTLDARLHGRNKMKLFAAAGLALSALVWAGAAQAQAKLCDKPGQMEGFKTCADVAKAKAEGAFTLYSTDPEQGQVKLLAAFNKVFPEIKTSYVRLQAGALYAKVLSERQAKSYLVDVIQISDMGMILDFQRKGGFRQYISPEMAFFNPK